MQTVGCNQERSFNLTTVTVAALEHHRYSLSVRVIAIACYFQPCTNGSCAKTLQRGAIQQHLQLTAVHGVLRPIVAGLYTPQFGIDFTAVETDENPLSGLHSDRIERF